jgi:hypothetical protein
MQPIQFKGLSLDLDIVAEEEDGGKKSKGRCRVLEVL